MGDNGRPSYSEEQYKQWLNLMTPFLVAGNSLSYAITKCGLFQHRTTLYEKQRLNDWFSNKIHDLQKIPGELINETFYLLIRQINKKVRAGEEVTSNEISILKHFSEKHRSSQAFFVNRQEVVPPEPNDIKAVLNRLEQENLKTDYGLLAKRLNEKTNVPKLNSTPNWNNLETALITDD